MATAAQYVLLIDTCGEFGSVALATAGEDARVLGVLTLPGRAASERLVPSVQQIVEQQGIALNALRAIAVVHGPGSFTGVRVGLSAANGLCEALGIPLIAISRLAVLASVAAGSGATAVLPLLDAGRGEFYVGRYVGGLCEGEFLCTGEQLKEMIRGEPGLLVAVSEPAVAERVADSAPLLLREVEAADALGIAVSRLQTGAFDGPSKLDANYVRKTDAEIFAKPARLAVGQVKEKRIYARPATAADVPAIVALERDVDFAPHWPEESYAQIMDAGERKREQEGGLVRSLFVAVRREADGAGAKDEVVGFAVGSMVSAGDAQAGHVAELESVAVQAEVRRQGIGRLLCRQVIEWSRAGGATELYLEARAESTDAIGLYRSLGFVNAGMRAHYYRTPEDDAVLMRLNLAASSALSREVASVE